MATNGGAHKFNKNDNNWLHKHFEPQQVDVVVSSISKQGLESLSAFPRTHPDPDSAHNPSSEMT